MRARRLLLLVIAVVATSAITRAADPPRVIELREAESPFVALNVWVRNGSSAKSSSTVEMRSPSKPTSLGPQTLSGCSQKR